MRPSVILIKMEEIFLIGREMSISKIIGKLNRTKKMIFWDNLQVTLSIKLTKRGVNHLNRGNKSLESSMRTLIQTKRRN